MPGSYESKRPFNITGIDKIHLKGDCIQGSIVDRVHEPVMYSFLSDKPPGHKFHHSAKNKLSTMVKEPVLSHITVYLEDDDHKPVDFNNGTLNFTCQLVK